MKIHAILVKNGFAITLKSMCNKQAEMADAQFTKKGEITNADILLTLNDKELFNVQTVDTILLRIYGTTSIRYMKINF